jgi:uncharacterized cupin superfamily protein
VLEGRPTVRHPDGFDELAQWDMAFFPRGPEGAHQVRNDSDKIAITTADQSDNLIVERSSGVDYWKGEG